MTFVVGRRRIGKTSLLANSFTGKKMVYFFVENSSGAIIFEKELQHFDI
jgi:AAA+ ATPase superfamily predicted ATPase